MSWEIRWTHEKRGPTLAADLSDVVARVAREHPDFATKSSGSPSTMIRYWKTLAAFEAGDEPFAVAIELSIDPVR